MLFPYFWKDKIHDDSKNQPNGNKLRTYRIFKKCYESETYLFVNELSKSEISTFAKLRISSHDLHMEKGRHRKTINLVKENAFYVAWLLKMRNILLWNVTHFQLIEILFLII